MPEPREPDTLRERAELVAVRHRLEDCLKWVGLARQHAELFADTEHEYNEAYINLVMALEHLQRARDILARKVRGS